MQSEFDLLGAFVPTIAAWFVLSLAMFVAVDALPAQLSYLRDGHVQVLLAQDCYGWGYKSVELVSAVYDSVAEGQRVNFDQ